MRVGATLGIVVGASFLATAVFAAGTPKLEKAAFRDCKDRDPRQGAPARPDAADLDTLISGSGTRLQVTHRYTADNCMGGVTTIRFADPKGEKPGRLDIIENLKSAPPNRVQANCDAKAKCQYQFGSRTLLPAGKWQVNLVLFVNGQKKFLKEHSVDAKGPAQK